MNKKTILLTAIILLAVFLRIMYMQSGITYPTSNLAHEANNLKEGVYDPNEVWHPMGVRYVLVMLVSLSFTLFGVSKFALFLVSFIFSIANILLLYLFGKLLVNEDVGLLAAFFLAVLPLDVFNATIQQPRNSARMGKYCSLLWTG